MFEKITVKLRFFFYILLYMKLSCNSLAEVWGNMDDMEEEMTSYKDSFMPMTEHMANPIDSNDDFKDMMDVYSSESDTNNDDEITKKSNEKSKQNNMLEGFINKIKDDLEDDNNDLILLVILGIFIIFVLDSLVKMKISFK